MWGLDFKLLQILAFHGVEKSLDAHHDVVAPSRDCGSSNRARRDGSNKISLNSLPTKISRDLEDRAGPPDRQVFFSDFYRSISLLGHGFSP
jgi:hypothetical protein